MRKVKKGKINQKVLDAIARNYAKLRLLCNCRPYGFYCGKSYEDIFQDTVLYVVQDEHAPAFISEAEIISYFCYRYRMIEYQTINDYKLLKETPYADYLQTRKEEDPQE